MLSSTYRMLADNLLQRNRVIEAQQVLDLLKVQELEEYLQNVRQDDSGTPLSLLPSEKQVITLYDQALQRGDRFAAFQQNSTVLEQVSQLQREAKTQTLHLEQLIPLQNQLKQVKNAAFFYPLVLADRLELVLIRSEGEPIRRSVAVDRAMFEGAIAEFREQIANPLRNKSSAAQQLYSWLIQPLESELQGIETLLYAADGQLRYVPLGALYDGQEWLIQRFTINYITAASFTDFTTTITANQPLRVLAGGFSEGEVQFQIGSQSFRFAGLPNAATELHNIASHVSNTTSFLNQQFNREMMNHVNEYSILHFATHAEFVPGSPEESFILFGNGDRVTLQDIATWQLPNVDLVVLSACQTAVGDKFGNGEEILGLGYQMQRTGAKAAIASLWSVDDSGTQMLMNAFYAALTQPNITKAEALRKAQIALITGDFASLGIPNPEQTASIHRPYYWAPFILIGDGV
ncbi:MAG: CHAT domain-containing protein [Oculatellaceae cyanobacterium Prado106]|nr:CHAT domain-containing protein [Oculatellaceae cyanobacterium Prado106]